MTERHHRGSRLQRLARLTFLVCLAAGPSVGTARAASDAVLKAQQQRVAVVEQVASTVVAIFGASGNGGGSGVLITPDGYAVTNFHVTSGAGDFMKCGLNDGKLYDAVIVGIDPTGDVALIKLLGRDDFPTAEMGDSDAVQVGDWTYAMGNPFLLATDFQPTVTFGIVSGVHRYQYPAGTILEYTDCIQVDTSINPGNSGGPLFDATGRLIGINGRGSFEKRGRVNSGAGYAISINQVRHFLGHLRSGRIVDHATLGATVGTGLNGQVVVSEILEQSEASRRNLQSGDEIVSFAGRPVQSVNQYKNILGIYPSGWKVPLVFRHDGEKQEVVVRLRPLHRKSELSPKKKPPMPQLPQPEDGEEDGEKKDDDGKKPKRLPQIPGHPQMQKPKPPEEYKHMLVKKDGYANWYFNEVEQERVLAGLGQLGSFDGVTGIWTLTGEREDGKTVSMTLADQGLGYEAPGTAVFQPLDGSPLRDMPEGSGGLLAGLHHFRLLLTMRSKPFTEFYYLGTEPLDGAGEPLDVLITVLNGATTRFYFHPGNGRLAGFDTSVGPDTDECEVRLDNWQDFSGHQLPASWTVRHARETFTRFQLKSADLRPATAAAGKDN